MGNILQTLSDLWEMLQDMLPDLLRTWPAPALQHMRLGPPDSQDNALMVRDPPCYLVSVAHGYVRVQLQTFTWEAEHEQMSWWRHIEDEMPTLAALGVTQLWLPPPNKAMRPVSAFPRPSS
jgi:alpha-amylase